MFNTSMFQISAAFVLGIGTCASIPFPIDAKDKTPVIGQQENADYSFQIINRLLQKITVLRIKNSEEDKFRNNILTTKQAIDKNERIEFNYTLNDEETIDTPFSMGIELSNGKKYILSVFPIHTIHKKLLIRKKDGVVYLQYKNTSATIGIPENQTVKSKTEKEGEDASNEEDKKSNLIIIQSFSTFLYNRNESTYDPDIVNRPPVTGPTKNETEMKNADTSENTNTTTKPTGPYGGACDTPKSCQKMRDEFAYDASNATDQTTDTTAPTDTGQ